MRKLSKPVAMWLMVWMVIFTVPATFAAEAVNSETAPLITNEGIDAAASQAADKVKPCSQVPYANILADPVDANFQPDTAQYKILTLTEEACGQMKTGSGKWVHKRLRKDDALAVPLSGKGDFLVVACGNNFIPDGPLTGKYFECPAQRTCPEPEIREIQVPGPERIVYRESPPPMRPVQLIPPTPWFCARGGWRTGTCIVVGLLVGGGIAAAAGGGKKDNSCPTCGGGSRPAP